MKLILLFATIFILSLVVAAPTNNPYSFNLLDVPSITNVTNSTVNATEFWCTTNQGCLSATSQIDHNLINNLLWSEAGHEFDEDVNFSGFAIYNISTINATIHNFINSGVGVDWNIFPFGDNLIVGPVGGVTSATILQLNSPVELAGTYDPATYGTTTLLFDPIYSTGSVITRFFDYNPIVTLDDVVGLSFVFNDRAEYTSTVDHGVLDGQFTYSFQPISQSATSSVPPTILIGLRGRPQMITSGTVSVGTTSNYFGTDIIMNAEAITDSGLTITNVQSYKAGASFTESASGFTILTIDNYIAFMSDTVTQSGTPIITNNFGFDSDVQTVGVNIRGHNSQIAAGSNRFNFYGGGTAPNYFEGDVKVGGGNDVALSQLHLEEAVGSLTLEGGNAGSGLEIYSIKWANTDTVTDYIAAIIQSRNEGAANDGNLEFFTTNAQTNTQMAIFHDSGNATFLFDVDVQGDLTVEGDLRVTGFINATTYHFALGGNITSNGTCVQTFSPDGSTVENVCDV